MTLIDHTEEWLRLSNAMNSTEDGEVSEEAEALMQEIEKDLASKVDGCVGYMEELRVSRTVCLDMADKYQKKADAWNKKMEWMKHRLLCCLHRMGTTELATAMHRLKITANGGVQAIELTADAIPKEYIKVKETSGPDFEKIRADLQAGKQLGFAKLKDRGVHLRIA